jgi:hypothetical protein
MRELAHEYLAWFGLLILAFIFLSRPSGTNALIGGLSNANTNAITSFQGGGQFVPFSGY